MMLVMLSCVSGFLKGRLDREVFLVEFLENLSDFGSGSITGLLHVVIKAYLWLHLFLVVRAQ